MSISWNKKHKQLLYPSNTANAIPYQKFEVNENCSACGAARGREIAENWFENVAIYSRAANSGPWSFICLDCHTKNEILKSISR